jgi:NAD(P)-dependent dehydrogenase (short-subunit alcohol dehydrogenase family)
LSAGPGHESVAHVIITGAAGGIGRAIAQRFTAQGSAVGLIDLPASGVEGFAAELRAAGATAIARTGDVSDEAGIGVAAREVCAELEQLTGPAPSRTLVTNAGVMSRVPLAELDEGETDRVYRINVLGTLHTFRGVHAWLAAAAQSSVVTMSSGAGLNPASVTGPAYRLAKAGIISLTRILAVELKHEGIRVNCIAPGGVDGGMSTAFSSDELRGMREAAIGSRLATVEDVAAAVAFVASPDAAFITGAIVPVTGGVVLS